jgi:hypothetical protein
MSIRNDLLEKILSAIQSGTGLTGRVNVTSAADLSGTLDSTKEYFIDGVIDMGSQSIEVPAGGLYLSGYNFDTSKLISTVAGYTMFKSPVGGSGNILGRDLTFTVSGAGSSLWSITGASGNEAIEFDKVNFNDCTSLGFIDDYRQYLEVGTGRFGGTPALEFRGAWNGARISTSIVRGISGLSALFKTGLGLTFSGRFITDINCDLPATGALTDLGESNILNDESMVLQGAFITRSGVINPNDTGITPNISADSVKSNWDSNTGVANTNKYIKSILSAQVETVISAIDTYTPLLGTFTVEKSVHFAQPSNGEFQCLTGVGDYLITGDFAIQGTANDVIDIRVTKSTDGGLTYPTELNHISRTVNNLVGPNDVAFFPLNFIANLAKGDRVRVEVENKTSSDNITARQDSFIILTEV